MRFFLSLIACVLITMIYDLNAIICSFKVRAVLILSVNDNDRKWVECKAISCY